MAFFDLFGGKLNIFRGLQNKKIWRNQKIIRLWKENQRSSEVQFTVFQQPPVMEIGVPDEDNDDSIDESEDDDTEDDDARMIVPRTTIPRMMMRGRRGSLS